MRTKIISVVGVSVITAIIAQANPSHPTVTQGSASFSTQGANLTVTTSDRAYINWDSFNIGVAETTTFAQPSSTSVVWNHINDSNPSQILGNLNANGLVVLQNPNGFYVGGNAAIRASGLVMSTAPTPQLDLSSGSAWDFAAPPPTAKIVNYGQINIGNGGAAYLIAHDIENHGTISAPNGNIGLFAGQQVMLSSRPDGRGISAEVNFPAGSVDNSGNLVADAGTIALHAQVVNQGGMIQANSVREQNGVVEIVASDTVNLSASSVIKANGDSGNSSGGNVTIHSGSTYSDQTGSQISVAGGAQGGNGGVVEISAPNLSAIHSTIDGHAASGNAGGRLVIDPTDIKIGNTGSDTAGTGTVGANDPPTTLNLNVNTAFIGFSQIDLQASRDITLLDGTTWDLAQSTGMSGPGCQLTLEAGRNINLGTRNGANIYGGNGWSLTLEAGRDFSTASDVVAGTGIIKLYGTGTIQAQDGSIALLAGDSISVGNGAVRTMSGGSITATAVSGNINTGQNTSGYTFSPTGYSVSANLGGISTAAGGDVTLTAGGNITSYLPTGNSKTPTDAGSGAFGSQPGVVTVTAGGDVTGHYVAADSERNGQIVASTITSQNGNAGNDGSLLALSLVKGGWEVDAPNGSIFLQEVRNPNGTLNYKTGAWRHLFDYNPADFVSLNAGDSVNLEGTLLRRYTGDAVPVVYPGTLTINAGAGGINLGNDLILFPSPVGNLNVTTTAGGWLEGNGYTLTMSDSADTQWTGAGFLLGHAPTPVQLNNPNPVTFNIDGSIDNISIVTPKQTQITVGGDVNNSSFSGQNLHPTDVTSLTVAGQIYDLSPYSFVTVSGSGLPLPPARYPGDKGNTYLQYLTDAVVPGSSPNSANAGALFPILNVFYDPTTHQLGYKGQMDLTTEQLLTGTLQVKTYLPNGKPALDLNGNYITKTVTFADPATIQALYAASQNADTPAAAGNGFQVAGPGQFNVTAQSINLGASAGINAIGPNDNPALVNLANTGADLNVDVTGDLTLFSSKISSWYGGNINIQAGGNVNAGFENLPLSDGGANGIWTSGYKGNVQVVADGDVNVAGSRIAAFNGGNVFVESTHGDVNAGSGGFNEVHPNVVVVDPKTGEVKPIQETVAASGIYAGTFQDAPKTLTVGDITVLTPQGNINCTQAGITQNPANGNTSLSPTLTLTAGTRNPDGSVLYAGDINAGAAGVLGINMKLNAAGNINGLVVALGNSSINAAENLSGTFVSGGNSSLSSGGSISGIAIAGGGISVGGGSFQGVALAQNVSGGGAQSALASTASANAGSSTAAAQETTTTTEKTQEATTAQTTDDKKKKAKRPLLAKYVGRVTVILPPKNL